MRNGPMGDVCVLGAWLACGACLAPPAAAQAGRIPYEAFTLPNGLHVLYSEDHSTPIVSVDVWYNAGSPNERAGRSGFAHLFEQAMFDASAAGKERRLRVDNQPYAPAFIDGMTWPFDSAGCFAYAHTVIGSIDDLNAAQLSDVKAFFDTYYAPNNATLVVVGDFRPLELRRFVNQYFGEIPRHPDPPSVSCVSRLGPGAAQREVTDAHANLPAVIHIYRVPPHADPDTPALELLNVILGEGESSRLNVAVVRREKAALGTQVAMNPFDSRRGPGVLLALAIANQGVDPLKLDTLLTAQLDSMRATGVTSEELTKAKNVFRAGFIHERETALGKAEELHHYDMFHTSLAEINSDLDRFLAVTADDIRRVAAKYLDPANALVIIVKPAASGVAQ